jgi:cysteine desulfurase
LNSPRPVYLDYAATTPVDPRVAAIMSACLSGSGAFGNPSSAHVYGAEADACVSAARAEVAALIGAAADEIVFTSGATESNNLGVLGYARANADRGRHLVSVRTEHKSVLDALRRLEREGFTITWLTPSAAGLVAPAALAAALRPDTLLASIMHANNETGVLQDIASLAAVCRERGVAFHTDAAQAAGKVPVDVHALGPDFLSFTAHKLYGPKGVGALYVRRGARAALQPLTFGGGQERGLRPGTLPTHQLAGFGAACEIARRELGAESSRLTVLGERLWAGLAALGGAHLNCASAPRVPGILNVSFAGVQGESLVAGLTGLALSTGAACDSDSPEPSYVLRALGRDRQLAESSLRFSLGRFTRETDVDFAIEAVRQVLARLRALSPGSAPGSAGDLPSAWTPAVAGGTARVVSGEAGGPGEDSWVRFQLLVAEDIVKDARFKAFGCPHTMSTAAWICGQLCGRSRAALIPGTPREWAQTQGVPVEKLGRLFAVEDALRACLAQWP